MIISDLLRLGSEELKKINRDRALFEARLLLAHSMNSSPEEIIQRDQESVSSDVEIQFRNLLERRLKFEPVAYLLGAKEFFGQKFKVNRDVLIPRPETESLVQGALDWIQENEIHSAKILELGTGSGCISISLATQLAENFEITALDISAAALQVAQENAKNHSVDITFKQMDFLKETFGNWNIIISNPPYIPTAEIFELQPDILNFEPRLALEAGEDGLRFLKYILNEWFKRLAKPGLLALETHGPEQIVYLKNLIGDCRSWQDGPHLFVEIV